MTTRSLPQPRVLFKVMGGPVIGMGQVIRSVELASAWQAAGIEAAGFVCNDDACSRAIVAARGHRIWSDARDFPNALIEAQADVLLFDQPGPHHPRCVEAHAIRPDLLLAALDCFEMEHADFDLIINLINHHPTLSAPLAPRVEYHEGPEFAIIRREFMALGEVPRRPAGPARKILVTFGGSDPQRHSVRVLEALRGLDRTEITVIVGPNFPHRAEVFRLAQMSGAVCRENVEDMPDLMHDADLALSGGGTTMLELAFLGTPALIIPQNEAEARFSASIAARDAVRTLRADLGPAELRRDVLDLLGDAATRERMSAAARQTVDGRGESRIAGLILNALSRRQTIPA